MKSRIKRTIEKDRHFPKKVIPLERFFIVVARAESTSLN